MTDGIIITDRHHLSTDPIHPSYLLAKKYIEYVRPDVLFDLGDTLDLPYFSNFDKEDILVQAEADWEDDVGLLNKEFDDLQQWCGEYYWILGNHDWRAAKYARIYPKFKSSVDYRRRFHIKDRPVTMYGPEDKACRYGKLTLIHGWWYNKYHTRKHLDEYAGNIVYGHVHKNQHHSKDLPAEEKSIGAWSLGCLCDKQPAYIKKNDLPTHWQNGFARVFFDNDGNFWLYPILIIKDKFVYEGEEWTAHKLTELIDKLAS